MAAGGERLAGLGPLCLLHEVPGSPFLETRKSLAPSLLILSPPFLLHYPSLNHDWAEEIMINAICTLKFTRWSEMMAPKSSVYTAGGLGKMQGCSEFLGFRRGD